MIFFWNNGWSVKVEERCWKSPPRDLNPGLSHPKSDATIWAFTIQSFQKESHLPRSIFSKIFSATYWKDFSFVANFFHNDKRILCSAGFGVYSPKKLEVDRGRQFYFNESTKSLLSSFFAAQEKAVSFEWRETWLSIFTSFIKTQLFWRKLHTNNTKISNFNRQFKAILMSVLY